MKYHCFQDVGIRNMMPFTRNGKPLIWGRYIPCLVMKDIFNRFLINIYKICWWNIMNIIIIFRNINFSASKKVVVSLFHSILMIYVKPECLTYSQLLSAQHNCTPSFELNNNYQHLAIGLLCDIIAYGI